MLLRGAAGAVDPSLGGPGGGQKLLSFLAAFLRLPPTVGMVLGVRFWASIISTIGPSFLIFGHLNISKVLEGY